MHSQYPRLIIFVMMASMMTLIITGVGVMIPTHADSAVSYNNIQIFITTESNNFTSPVYSVSAYDSSGYLVAMGQSEYPAFSFELPTGDYLFTVTAAQYSQQVYGYATVPSGYSEAGVAQSMPSQAYPVYYNPMVEYGYTTMNVTGPQSVNIQTRSISNIPDTKIKVQVNYANGTDASGVSVSASVIGEWYSWPSKDNTLVLWNQTGSDGSVTLSVPSVPVQVSAWTWLPVNLPENQTTVRTTVGGEEVNVTVYWQPSYVGLAGSKLIIPPQGSASITLHVQQPSYWIMPYGVRSYGAPMATSQQATIASGPSAVPSSQYQQSQGGYPFYYGALGQIAPLPAPSTVTTTKTITSGDYTTLLAASVVAALVIAVLGLAVAIIRRK